MLREEPQWQEQASYQSRRFPKIPREAAVLKLWPPSHPLPNGARVPRHRSGVTRAVARRLHEAPGRYEARLQLGCCEELLCNVPGCRQEVCWHCCCRPGGSRCCCYKPDGCCCCKQQYGRQR